jgi:hypothetical protein
MNRNLGCELESTDSVKSPVAVTFESVNEISGNVKWRNILDNWEAISLWSVPLNQAFCRGSSVRNTMTDTKDNLSDVMSNEVFSRNVTKLYSVFQ